MFVNLFLQNFGGRRESDILANFKEHNLTVQVVVEEITVHI